MYAKRILFLCLMALVAGCGSGSAPSVVAEQDELQKWVAENPEPADQDPSLLEGAVK
jgi:hypothetical protein